LEWFGEVKELTGKEQNDWQSNSDNDGGEDKRATIANRMGDDADGQ
jgi:hypothetical protein